jgi:hypothetical protein
VVGLNVAGAHDDDTGALEVEERFFLLLELLVSLVERSRTADADDDEKEEEGVAANEEVIDEDALQC